jgi:hypothetical protein
MAGSQRAAVTLFIDHLPDETVEWVIVDTFRTEVASGRVDANGRTADRFRALLPGAGRYSYLLYVNGTGDVLESFDFAVRACASAGLADTGAPSGALGGFIAALLAVPTGSFLIRRCRATSTPEPGQLGRIHADTSEEIGHASCFPSLANRGVR